MPEKCNCGSRTFNLIVDMGNEVIKAKCSKCGEHWADLDFKE